MSHFPIQTLDSAPRGSRSSLHAMQAAFGFLPNVVGVMANSPVLLDSLVALFGRVHGGSFSEPEIQVMLLTNAVTNASAWATAFHSSLALRHGIDPDDVEAIRSRGVPQEPRLAALSILAKGLIETRGRLRQAEIDAAMRSGLGPAHLLEVIAVSAASTITNYTANVANPPLEPVFADQVWHAP